MKEALLRFTASLERQSKTDVQEKQVIVQRILDESLRGVLLSKAQVRDMADRLQRERKGNPTAKNGFIALSSVHLSYERDGAVRMIIRELPARTLRSFSRDFSLSNQ